MLVPDDKPATVRTAEHYHRYRQQLARKGVTKKPHLISTKSNIKAIKLRSKKYHVSMAYTLSSPARTGRGNVASTSAECSPPDLTYILTPSYLSLLGLLASTNEALGAVMHQGAKWLYADTYYTKDEFCRNHDVDRF